MASSIMTESAFPYFFVGTFIEANVETGESFSITGFPYFFVGTFIEARSGKTVQESITAISLLFRRDFP